MRCKIAQSATFASYRRRVKSPGQRGEFGTWLRTTRLEAGYKNVPDAVEAMRKRFGYSIAKSVWAEMEAGSRRPSAEHRDLIERFLDMAAPTDDSAAVAGDLSALVAAIERQTQAILQLVEVTRADVTELRRHVDDRVDRLVEVATQGTTRGVTEALEWARREGLLGVHAASPETPPDEPAPEAMQGARVRGLRDRSETPA
jgi:hypothetical protein